jgi:hypothetical protein
MKFFHIAIGEAQNGLCTCRPLPIPVKSFKLNLNCSQKLSKNDLFVCHIAVGEAQPRRVAVAGVPTGRFLLL